MLPCVLALGKGESSFHGEVLWSLVWESRGGLLPGDRERRVAARADPQGCNREVSKRQEAEEIRVRVGCACSSSVCDRHHAYPEGKLYVSPSLWRLLGA